MPYPNEHAARMKQPGIFEEDSFRRVKIENGIDAIMGKLKNGGESMIVQAYRFDKDQFSSSEARDWLTEHKYRPISFEPASTHTISTNENRIDGELSILRDTVLKYDTFEGKKHLVVPTVLIVEGVLNGKYYPKDELKKFPQAWNGIPIPVFHPEKNGTPISSNDKKVIEQQSVGHIFNVEYDETNGKGRLKGESWINVDKCNRISPVVLNRLLAHDRLEVSTGLFTEDEYKAGTFNGKQYNCIARNYRPDHLAVLPEGLGACNWQDGAGMPRVNSAVCYSCGSKDVYVKEEGADCDGGQNEMVIICNKCGARSDDEKKKKIKNNGEDMGNEVTDNGGPGSGRHSEGGSSESAFDKASRIERAYQSIKKEIEGKSMSVRKAIKKKAEKMREGQHIADKQMADDSAGVRPLFKRGFVNLSSDEEDKAIEEGFSSIGAVIANELLNDDGDITDNGGPGSGRRPGDGASDLQKRVYEMSRKNKAQSYREYKLRKEADQRLIKKANLPGNHWMKYNRPDLFPTNNELSDEDKDFAEDFILTSVIENDLITDNEDFYDLIVNANTLGGFLVEGKEGKHLPTSKDGKPDHRLMGAAWASLHGGYRGNKYEGPSKQDAIMKLKKLYEQEKMPVPTANENNPSENSNKGEDDKMANKTKKERVAELVQNSAGTLTEQDVEMLEKMDDSIFEKMETTIKTNADLLTANKAEMDKLKEEKKVLEEKVSANDDSEEGKKKQENKQTPPVTNQSKPVSIADYLNNAPPQIKEVLSGGLRMVEARKSAIIGSLKANARNAFTDQELASKSIDELEKLSRLIEVEQPSLPVYDYSGRGLPIPTTNSVNGGAGEVLTMPTLSYNKEQKK